MKRIIMLMTLLTTIFVIVGCSGTTSVELISPDAYVNQFSESETEHILIDVRTRGEFARGHIAGAVNIPVEEIANRLDEIPANTPVIVYCQSGNRSGRAGQILSQNDFSDIYDLGGIIRWQSSGYPIQ